MYAHMHACAAAHADTHQPRSFYSQMVVGGSFEAVKLLEARSDTDSDASHGPPQPIYWNNYSSPGGAAGTASLDSAVAFHGSASMKIESRGAVGTTLVQHAVRLNLVDHRASRAQQRRGLADPHGLATHAQIV